MISVTGRQVRAARALLEWDAEDLAEKANLSRDTVFNIERGAVQAREATRDRIVQTFAAYDVEFIPDEGVKKKSDTITKLEGFNDFKSFMDQIYEAATKSYSRDEKPICVCNVDNNIFRKHLKDYYLVHLERMKKLEGVQIRILAPDIDKNQPPDVHY